MGVEREPDNESTVHNELSGSVTGPVGQFGAVYGDVHIGVPGDASGQAEWQARYRARLEQQWAEEDAARAAEHERAERLRQARDEVPAIRWLNENAAWRKKITVLRNWTLALFGIGIPCFAAFAMVGDDSNARGILATGAILTWPGIFCFVRYVTVVVRYHLWRGW
jgi:hypothetical protein